MPNSDDLSLFQKMMEDVKPLTQNTTLHISAKPKTTEAQLARRIAAQSLNDNDPDYLSTDHAPMVHPDDIIEFKRDGVQEGVYKKLRLGKYDIQARLDLNRKTIKEARDELLCFLKKCQAMDVRTVIIAHGRAANSPRPALLKSFVAHWLQHIQEVMCFHSAQHFHGGTGALYVMLKKSPAKKLENREKHQKRSS